MDLKYAIRGANTLEKMKYTGQTIDGRWLWTKEEDQKIIDLYPDYIRLTHELPRRTLDSIRDRSRVLNVAKSYHSWTAAEVSKLRKLYPTATHTELLAAFPNLNLCQIRCRARASKFYRARMPYKKTGYPLLDDILTFALENNMRLADLDALAGTKNYFQKGHWRNGSCKNQAIYHVAIALGGTVRVEWPK